MSTALELIAEHLPEVTTDKVRRSFSAIEIHDPEAFASELMAFVQNQVEAVQLPFDLAVIDLPEDREAALASKVAKLRAKTSWTPGATEIQRGRALMLEEFAEAHNLPVPEFARLANKSKQQIYKDIDAGRLLALSLGARGQKLPDWQLDPNRQRLTQQVLQGAPDVDKWTIYNALGNPLEALGGRSPVQAVDNQHVEKIAGAVFNVLGIVRPEQA